MIVFNINSIHLCSLCMEWNDLGLIENAFSVFCDGVAGNSTLSILDLRSNQISHVGACELANAVKRNLTLQTLGISQFVYFFARKLSRSILLSLQVALVW